MIPDYQTLMKPVLRLSATGEIRSSEAIDRLADEFNLSEAERSEMLPSGKQARFANRVHWARTYLKQAGLLQNTRRAHFTITKRGLEVLRSDPKVLNSAYLEKFDEYLEFKSRKGSESRDISENETIDTTTPDELIRTAHQSIVASLAADLLDRLRASPPVFFENVIVRLLLSMGYGYNSDAGQVVGQSGDDGVDGVINLDPLGVDQVYIQAKRYGADAKIGSGAIRDFYGALGLKDVTKGIFVTTSSFSPNAVQTAEKLGARIVLIDGVQLGKLMVAHEIGCRVTDVYKVASVDESFFDET